MKIPTIHSNGTSKATLTREIDTAIDAVANALNAVKAITVNARDYYVKGVEAGQPEAFDIARAEQRARIRVLEALETELYTLAIGIGNQS